jgi:polyphosphate kinase 2 (PPK2 family)
VLKFFLNVSRDEQKRRFLERLNEPSRNWKFSSADVRERGHWDEYQAAYEQAIRATATPHAPWYVVPADNKWYLRLVVVAAVVQALEEMDLAYPRVGEDQRHELDAARTLLEQER